MSNFAAIIQMVTTIVLTFVTWQYVRLTRQLVQIQIDPRVDLEIHEDSLESSKILSKVVNRSSCDIEDLQVQVSALYFNHDGNLSNVMKCIGTQEWPNILKPKYSIDFDIKQYFDFVSRIKAKDDLPDSLLLAEDLIDIRVSYRRTADSKQFAFKEIYKIRIDEGNALISRIAPREKITSLEAHILKRIM